ncbi:hypothetical protein SAMN05216228_104616 [Rhizobium tibeticum]|uniref:Core-binding (CB) domain-containing protein n=1 Tax=Rhizobium tibeticum TaxID=501024 RepID=A0A1H8VQU9_9HYPH|nr:hypothetical protein [Rhizobium tibeticum]SEI19486.1 hypothetical protein RTCCBAU85039_6167 [Rhizobium tibeticum]SEP17782.1 hypothetical protein SAMN05216228_104616 [Rhizobium tibeticum]
MTSGEMVIGEMDVRTIWIARYRQGFLEGLTAQGYARCTLRTYERIVAQFCAEVEKRGLSAGKLDAAAVEALRQAVLAEANGSAHTYAKFCLNRFIGHLVDAGVASLPNSPPRSQLLWIACARNTTAICASNVR